jgi:uncharacterized protein (TIGR02996 family)
MTADGTALLAAALAAPADDAPRLVYADWLEEQGDGDRAEFIRLQIRIAGMGLSNGGIRKAGPLFRRDRQLFELAERELHLLIDLYGYQSPNRLPGNLQPHLDSRWGDDMVIQPNSAADTQPRRSGVGLFARGFVREVRAPLAVLVGGECERCEGQGSLIGDPECDNCHGAGRAQHLDDDEGVEDCPACDRMDCPACCGSGRTPGVLAALCAAHPVEKVVATDREPVWGSTPVGWVRLESWSEQPDPARRDYLPAEIYELLDGGKEQYDAVEWMRYPTRGEADAALERALLAHARQPAGRPATA